jgi:malonate transporter
MSVALLLLPDFMLIVGGALLKRRGGFGAPFWSGVERLVYFVLFPALLFRSLAHAPLSLGAAGRLVAVGLAFTLGGMALSALTRPLFGLPRPTFAACFQCGFRFNTYVALAAASRLGGEAALATISVLVGVLVPVVNFAAIAWHLTGWPLPEVVAHLVDLLASAALPLGLLAVGAGLTLGRATLPLPALAWWSAVKLVAVPSIALAAAHLAGLPPLERAAAVVLAAVPTAPSAYILAMQMTGHGAPVAILISTGTVLAAGTLPLWLEVIGPLAGP